MIAFEVFINGQRRFTAGGEDYQALNALLGLVQLPLPKPDDVHITFSTSAITPEAARVALWPTVELAVGDRVEIRVVDVSTVDAPESVETPERGDENVDA